MAHKAVMTYSFTSVSESDAAVFKSIVGLLASRTLVVWEPVSSGPSDLQVSAANGLLGQSQLSITLNSGDTGMRLSLPLRVFEVFSCLEAAQQRNSDVLPTVARQSSSDLSPISLRRWPDTSVLGRSPHYIRLTAAISSRPMNAAQLAVVGHVSIEVAKELIALLLSTGYAQHAHPVVHVECSIDKQPRLQGLFARIRSHLGLTPREV